MQLISRISEIKKVFNVLVMHGLYSSRNVKQCQECLDNSFDLFYALVARKPVFDFPIQPYLDQHAQLQRLARDLKFACSMFRYNSSLIANSQGADQSARMRNPEDRYSPVEADITFTKDVRNELLIALYLDMHVGHDKNQYILI